MRSVMKNMVLPMAAFALLEDLANGAVRRERLFREREDLLASCKRRQLAHKPISNVRQSMRELLALRNLLKNSAT